MAVAFRPSTGSFGIRHPGGFLAALAHQLRLPVCLSFFVSARLWAGRRGCSLQLVGAFLGISLRLRFGCSDQPLVCVLPASTRHTLRCRSSLAESATDRASSSARAKSSETGTTESGIAEPLS